MGRLSTDLAEENELADKGFAKSSIMQELNCEMLTMHNVYLVDDRVSRNILNHNRQRV